MAHDPAGDPVILDVRGYGAACDGETDDTAAIQATIDAAASCGGGIVYLPPGTYRVSKTQWQSYALLMRPHVRLVGAAAGVTTVRLVDDTQAIIAIVHAESAHGMALERLTFDGNRANVYQSDQMAAVRLISTEGAVIRECVFREPRGDGLLINGPTSPTAHLLVEACEFHGAGRSGITLGSGHQHVTIRDCWFHGDFSSQPIDSEPAIPSVTGGVLIDGCHIDCTDTPGGSVLTCASVGDNRSDFRVVNNTLIDVCTHLGGTIGAVFTGNVFTVNQPLLYEVLRAAGAVDVDFHHNHVQVNVPQATRGFVETTSLTSVPRDTGNLRITDNTFRGHGQVTVRNAHRVTVRGNTIEADPATTYAEGIMFWAQSAVALADTTIADNDVIGYTQGMTIQTSRADYTFTGCRVTGNRFRDCGEGIWVGHTTFNSWRNGEFAGNIATGTTPTLLREGAGTFLTSQPSSGQLPEIVTGRGSPEGVRSAAVGSLYLRLDGGTGTALYVKESGTGNTGWASQ